MIQVVLSTRFSTLIDSQSQTSEERIGGISLSEALHLHSKCKTQQQSMLEWQISIICKSDEWQRLYIVHNLACKWNFQVYCDRFEDSSLAELHLTVIPISFIRVIYNNFTWHSVPIVEIESYLAPGCKKFRSCLTILIIAEALLFNEFALKARTREEGIIWNDTGVFGHLSMLLLKYCLQFDKNSLTGILERDIWN